MSELSALSPSVCFRKSLIGRKNKQIIQEAVPKEWRPSITRSYPDDVKVENT